MEIGSEPDPFLHLLTLEQMFSLFNKLIGPHLNVFVEKVAPEYLLAVFVVEQVRDEEGKTECSLCHELQVLVVEEDVVVVEED